ncbi:MAG: tetratricopeptide repeat protein [Clostridia bacterium]|nr:tetratricopeptide repeat protein [Clostridia bacterium]
MIQLADRIKEFRRRDGRTQEALANALGVTPQAVSRWEKGLCYPDMGMIPSIANVFGVSIDELFGYDNERSRKVDALTERIRGMIRENNGADVSMDQCIALAREGLIEFPGNEKLTLALASALYTAGYVRHGELHLTDADGYGVYDVRRHRTYPEWQEAVKLYEKLLPALTDGKLRRQAVKELSQLYRNLGEREKALALAEEAPDLYGSAPFLRINAFDGREAVAACGEALLETVRTSGELMVRILLNDRNIPPKTAADLLKNGAELFRLVCTEGDYGRNHGFLACLHMLRAYYLWQSGAHDEAFAALDLALDHAQSADRLFALGDSPYASPLLRQVRIPVPTEPKEGAFSRELPELWPWWDVPDRDEVKSQMAADPRWASWVDRTRA